MSSCLGVAAAVPAQAPASGFAYRAGERIEVAEVVEQRETDARIGFAIATRHRTTRRYTVLDVAADGSAEVLVEQDTGAQELLEYRTRGEDRRDEHLARGFAPDATKQQRVVVARFTPQRFRAEPARDEPAVFYLQELPELLACAVSLPVDGAATWRVEAGLPRLRAAWQCRRDGDTVRGILQLVVTDPRVRDGAEVPCPDGELAWQPGPDGLPAQWQITLRYPRFPIDRPNVQTVTGQRTGSGRLDAPQLTALRDDLAAFTVVRDTFFAGRFPAALAAAADFTTKRAASPLRPAVDAAVAAFRAQVPQFGRVPPEPAVAHWFGAPAATTLAALRGKVAVLDFWATWCVPCVAGMAHLIELQGRHRDDGLAVLGLTRLDPKQTLDAVRSFHAGGYAEAHGGTGINYPLVVLGDDATHRWFSVRAIPVLVVLDRNGAVYWQQTGGGSEARLARIVAAALAAR